MPISRRSCTSRLSQFRNAAWSSKKAIFSGLMSEEATTQAEVGSATHRPAHTGSLGEEHVYLGPALGLKYLFLFLFAFPFGHCSLKHVLAATSSCLHATTVLTQDRVSKVSFVFNHAQNAFFDSSCDHQVDDKK
jgi:hypothetical protein